MLRRDPFGSVVRAVSRRPWLVIALVGALAIGGAALALRLQPSTDIGTLVDRSSDSFEATEEASRVFGGDAVIVLVDGPLETSLLTPDLGRLRDLEGCLAGNAPASDTTLPASCRELAAERPAQVVYGPATFVNQAAIELNQQLQRRLAQNEQQADLLARSARRSAAAQGASLAQQGRAADKARRLARSQLETELIGLALRYGLTTPPALNNPAFVERLVFEPADPGGVTAARVPKERFAGFFPADDAALIQVRLRPDLSEDERERAIELIEETAAAERFQPQRGARLVVTGVPVVIEELAEEIERSLVLLLIAAVLVMAGTLALVFRSRLRLLPLFVALAAAGLTYGAVSLVGGGLTMASVAALPVLIGLAVDYAIQFQSRFDEVRGIGAKPPPAGVAAPTAATAGAPTIVAAGMATVAGFLVLLLSPAPMVRGFGLILVAGVVLALACALTAGFAALVLLSDRSPGRRRRSPRLARARAVARRRLAAGARALRGVRAPSFVARWAGRVRIAATSWPRRALSLALERPRRVLAVGLALAALGWALDTQTEVVSDVRELVPQDLPALENLTELQEATGVSGQIDVILRGDNLTDPAVIDWMDDFRAEVLAAHGYEPGARCSADDDAPELCPALGLPDLPGTRGARSAGEVEAVLDAIPPYFRQALISADRNFVDLAFGIRLMPLGQQQDLIEDIRDRLEPPAGVEAELTGVPVLAAEGNEALSSPLRRLALLAAGLAAVFVLLLALRRSARRAAVPLIPIALATGWAALILFVLRVPLNPMSAALGAVVIAISTEFSVLLSSRYQEERRSGASPRQAIELAYGSTGAAVLASGVTAIAGFLVLAVPFWSEIEMLRDFGLVTVVGLGVSLLGVMVALPAALVWAAEHGPFGVRDLDPRPAAAALRREITSAGEAARTQLRRPRRKSRA